MSVSDSVVTDPRFVEVDLGPDPVYRINHRGKRVRVLRRIEVLI
ncbi:hypothetical protein [Rhodococcus sp. NPDC060176]